MKISNVTKEDLESGNIMYNMMMKGKWDISLNADIDALKKGKDFLAKTIKDLAIAYQEENKAPVVSAVEPEAVAEEPEIKEEKSPISNIKIGGKKKLQ